MNALDPRQVSALHGNWFGTYTCAQAPASSPTSSAVTLRPDRVVIQHIGRCTLFASDHTTGYVILGAAELQKPHACSSAYSVICETLHTHCASSAPASTASTNRVRHLETPRANVPYLQLPDLKHVCGLQLGFHKLALERSLIIARLHKLSSYTLHKYSQLSRICTTTPGVRATTLIC